MIIARYLPEVRRRPKTGLAIAVALLALCFALRYFTPLRLTYVAFYPAIMLATFVAGRWIGAAVTLSAAFLALYFFRPTTELELTSTDVWGLGAFLVVSAIIIFTTELLATTVTRLSNQSERLVQSEENTRVLMRELTHRMKNQYAVILAMARVTERSTSTVPQFLEAFSRRVNCLSRTHDLLVKSEWKGVSLRELIDIEMDPFAMGHAYSAMGPAVEIKDGAVVYLGMALHELATNSAKHGAWSKNHGTVSLEWHVSADEIFFQWTEKDGPEVGAVGSSGFGRTLLESLVPQALGGESKLEFDRHGLRWAFKAPIVDVLAARMQTISPALTSALNASA